MYSFNFRLNGLNVYWVGGWGVNDNIYIIITMWLFCNLKYHTSKLLLIPHLPPIPQPALQARPCALHSGSYSASARGRGCGSSR